MRSTDDENKIGNGFSFSVRIDAWRLRTNRLGEQMPRCNDI